MTLRTIRVVALFLALGLTSPVWAQQPARPQVLTASLAALPCVDCLWHGHWCQICLDLPLTLNTGGTSGVSEGDLARLRISPWLVRVSKCLAEFQAEDRIGRLPDGPIDLRRLALLDRQGQKLDHIQTCVTSEAAPFDAQKPRWRIVWEEGALVLENTRDTPETALIILAGHDLASDTMFNVALPPEVAAISVKAGGQVRIPLPIPELLAVPGMSVEVAVTSATRLTSDRSEQTVLSFTPNQGDD